MKAVTQAGAAIVHTDFAKINWQQVTQNHLKSHSHCSFYCRFALVKQATLILTSTALLFGPFNSSYAVSDAELKSIVQQQQETLKEVQVQLKNTQNKLRSLEDQTKRTKRAAASNRNLLVKQQDKMRFDGFVTAGVARTAGTDASLMGSIGSDLTYQADSVAGMQMTYLGNEQLSFTMQLVSRGDEMHMVKTDWAYIKYAFTDSLDLKAGRLRIPYYMFSQSLEVGFSYPWVRLPVEQYNIPLASHEGFELTKHFQLAKWSFDSYGFVGRGIGEETVFAQSRIAFNDHWGVGVFASHDAWLFRIAYSQTNLKGDPIEGGNIDQLSDGFTAAGDAAKQINDIGKILGTDFGLRETFRTPDEEFFANYGSIGFTYDDGEWLAIGEFARVRILDEMPFPGGHSGYLLLAYYYNKFTPYISISKFYTDDEDDHKRDIVSDQLLAIQNAVINGAPVAEALGLLDNSAAAIAEAQKITQMVDALNSLDQQQTSYTVGLAYNITSRMKAKIEAAYYGDFAGGTGRFQGNPGDHATVYSFALDAVF